MLLDSLLGYISLAVKEVTLVHSRDTEALYWLA